MTNSPLFTSVFAQAAQRWHYISVTYNKANTIFIYKLGPFVNIKVYIFSLQNLPDPNRRQHCHLTLYFQTRTLH